MAQFKIPESNLGRLDDAIAKLSKICQKLGQPLPQKHLVEVVQEKKKTRAGLEYITEYHIFEIEGVTPKLDGWNFKSKLEKMDDGDEIRSVPGFELPAEFHKREVCDHCKQRRNRNRYFFVEKEGVALAQVGSNCVKDFLGHKNPEVVAAWFEWIGAVSACQEERDDYGPRPVFLWDFDMALSVAINYIKEFGFMSRKRADELSMGRADEDRVLTTANRISDKIWPMYSTGKDRMPMYEPTEDDLKNVAALKLWFADKVDFGDSDFISNVKNTLNAGIGIRPRKIGVIAAAVNQWVKATTEAKEFAKRKPSVYFGQEKDKIKDRPVQFLRAAAFDGAYGTNYIYTFVDEEHEFVWSTGSKWDFEKDEKVLLSGSVKGHKAWTDRGGNEHKQTLVTRCKIEEVKDAA